jgi:hypothetical protein
MPGLNVAATQAPGLLENNARPPVSGPLLRLSFL